MQPTWLKSDDVQASDLDEKHKFFIKPGGEFPLHSYSTNAKTGHLVVTFGKDKDGHQLSFQGRNRWYVFKSHVQVLENGAATHRIPKEIHVLPKEPLKGAFRIPGFESIFYLNQPIFPGSTFYWDEATHGGTRIPTKEAATRIIQLVKKLQPYRNDIGEPFRVTSFYRPEPFNSRVGGAKYSQHLTGGAIDFYIVGWDSFKLYNYFHPRWDGGLGKYKYDNHIIHLDIASKRRWYY